MNKPKRIVAITLAGLICTSPASFAAEQRGKPSERSNRPSKLKIEPVSVEPEKPPISENSSNVATFVFEKVSKSVVIVEAVTSEGKIQGSGVVYDNNRWFGPVSDIALLQLSLFDIAGNNFSRVVTNAHVVTNASKVSVLQGGKRYRAEVSYVNDEFDLVLLIVFGILPVSSPSSSTELRVGEKVFAIGSPLGLENSISEGIISGMRERNGVLLLQTTAPVSRGSSGGGLFDAKGRFIGVTTFKLVEGENLSFAVDAELVADIDSAQQAAMALVSCKMPEHFSKDKIDALTEWLFKAPGGISQKLSTVVKLQKSFEVCKDSEQIFEQFSKDQGSKTAKTTTETRNKSEKESKKNIRTLPCHGSAPADILYCLESLAGTALPSRCIGTTAEQISYCGHILMAGRLDLSKGVVEPVPTENYKEAILYYNIAIQVDSKYIPAYVARAEAYLKLGNYQDAIIDWKTAAKLGDSGAQAELRRRRINW
jgi:S1-C subfamily serine protease